MFKTGIEEKDMVPCLKPVATRSILTERVTNPRTQSDYFLVGWIRGINYLYHNCKDGEAFEKFKPHGISVMMFELMQAYAKYIDDPEAYELAMEKWTKTFADDMEKCDERTPKT